jgi:hypothetical protein
MNENNNINSNEDSLNSKSQGLSLSNYLLLNILFSLLTILVVWFVYYVGNLFWDGKLDKYLILNDLIKDMPQPKSGKLSIRLSFLKYFLWISFLIFYFISALIAIVLIFKSFSLWFMPIKSAPKK